MKKLYLFSRLTLVILHSSLIKSNFQPRQILELYSDPPLSFIFDDSPAPTLADIGERYNFNLQENGFESSSSFVKHNNPKITFYGEKSPTSLGREISAPKELSLQRESSYKPLEIGSSSHQSPSIGIDNLIEPTENDFPPYSSILKGATKNDHQNSNGSENFSSVDNEPRGTDTEKLQRAMFLSSNSEKHIRPPKALNEVIDDYDELKLYFLSKTKNESSPIKKLQEFFKIFWIFNKATKRRTSPEDTRQLIQQAKIATNREVLQELNLVDDSRSYFDELKLMVCKILKDIQPNQQLKEKTTRTISNWISRLEFVTPAVLVNLSLFNKFLPYELFENTEETQRTVYEMLKKRWKTFFLDELIFNRRSEIPDLLPEIRESKYSLIFSDAKGLSQKLITIGLVATREALKVLIPKKVYDQVFQTTNDPILIAFLHHFLLKDYILRILPKKNILTTLSHLSYNSDLVKDKVLENINKITNEQFQMNKNFLDNFGKTREGIKIHSKGYSRKRDLYFLRLERNDKILSELEFVESYNEIIREFKGFRERDRKDSRYISGWVSNVNFSTLSTLDNIQMLNDNLPEPVFRSTKQAQRDAISYLKQKWEELAKLEVFKDDGSVDEEKVLESNDEATKLLYRVCKDPKNQALSLASAVTKYTFEKLLPGDFHSCLFEFKTFKSQLILFNDIIISSSAKKNHIF